MAATIVRCRVLGVRQNQCTGEAVDPTAELLICRRHLAEAMRLIQDAAGRIGNGSLSLAS